MNAHFTSFVVKVRTIMALRKVLIRHKSKGMLLASTDDDKLKLTDIGKQAPTWSKALWEFTQDGLVTNQFHDYQKYSIPGHLLQMLEGQKQKCARGECWLTKLATNCACGYKDHPGEGKTGCPTHQPWYSYSWQC